MPCGKTPNGAKLRPQQRGYIQWQQCWHRVLSTRPPVRHPNPRACTRLITSRVLDRCSCTAAAIQDNSGFRNAASAVTRTQKMMTSLALCPADAATGEAAPALHTHKIENLMRARPMPALQKKRERLFHQGLSTFNFLYHVTLSILV